MPLTGSSFWWVGPEEVLRNQMHQCVSHRKMSCERQRGKARGGAVGGGSITPQCLERLEWPAMKWLLSLQWVPRLPTVPSPRLSWDYCRYGYAYNIRRRTPGVPRVWWVMCACQCDTVPGCTALSGFLLCFTCSLDFSTFMHKMTRLTGRDWGATWVPAKKMSATLVAPSADRHLKLSITKGFCLTPRCNFTFRKKKRTLCVLR